MQDDSINSVRRSSSKVTDIANSALDTVEQAIKAGESNINSSVDPLRRSASRRFPSLFLLAVTFGFTATMVGIEQLLIKHQVLRENPGLILLIGITILVITGTTYKKLG